MVWMFAIDAGMEKHIASKAFSTGQHHTPEKKWQDSTGMPSGERRACVGPRNSGLQTSMTPGQAEAILAKILQPINEAAGILAAPMHQPHFHGVRRAGLPPRFTRANGRHPRLLQRPDRLRHHLIGSLGKSADHRDYSGRTPESARQEGALTVGQCDQATCGFACDPSSS